MLSRYVNGPWELMNVLDNTESVISGSTALAFFIGPAVFTPTDLDIYTPKGGAHQLQRYLAKEEGYQHISVAAGYTSYDDVLTVVRMYRSDIRIDIVESDDSNSSTIPITHFWTPALRNIIGFNRYSSAYPCSIQSRMAAIADGHLSDNRIADVVLKYSRRGFLVTTDINPDTVHGNEMCPSVWRSFDDGLCLKGTFATAVESGKVSDDSLVKWRLGGSACVGCQRVDHTMSKTFVMSVENLDDIIGWLEVERKSSGGYGEYARFVAYVCQLRDKITVT